MAITKQITQPPEAPQRSDPDTFADRADAFVAWLETFRNDLTEWTGQLNSTQNQINALQNIRVYSDSDTYNFPDLVVASDGYVYRCLGSNVQGDNPVSSNTGNWVRITNAYIDNLGSITKPSINDDISKGYSIGSKWVSLTNRRVYLCVDATEGNATWLRIDNRMFLHRGLVVSNSGGITTHITAKYVSVFGYEFNNIDISIDMTQADVPNGYDSSNGSPAEGDFWYFYLITKKNGEDIAGWMSKTYDNPPLPDGYVFSVPVSFGKVIVFNDNLQFSAFRQVNNRYAYSSYHEILPQNAPSGQEHCITNDSDNPYIYDVSEWITPYICSEVELAVYMTGNDTDLNDTVYVWQQGIEYYSTDVVRLSFTSKLFCFLPVSEDNMTVEMFSSNAVNDTYVYVKGARLMV